MTILVETPNRVFLLCFYRDRIKLSYFPKKSGAKHREITIPLFKKGSEASAINNSN